MKGDLFHQRKLGKKYFVLEKIDIIMERERGGLMEHFGRKCEGRFPQSNGIAADFPVRTTDRQNNLTFYKELMKLLNRTAMAGT